MYEALTQLEGCPEIAVVMTGKAMIVCMSRRNSVKMYEALSQLEGCPEIAVVMTGNISKDPITWNPHIRTQEATEALKKRFRNPKDPLQIVIVRDMWLTGFDAPCVHTMYVDKIMKGQWNRESNRGHELDGKTVGIIGYGNMGKAFAKKLRGFDVEVICHDILPNVGDANAKQVTLEELQQKADVLSLHIPWTPETDKMVNADFIASFSNPFWLINTSRGKNVVTADLVQALESGKILGAGLDVLEYEKLSFETLFNDKNTPEAFDYLLKSSKVLLSPHIAGWTFESHERLAQVIVDKIKLLYDK
jgi:lactate dehydrogenase-like 2-hydroxyacid dehydrogenase